MLFTIYVNVEKLKAEQCVYLHHIICCYHFLKIVDKYADNKYFKMR